ncbi:hypothetical protein ABZY68_23760 [Streptomyces sp. NPDC006482]|uniref:hypothetical protein n=1 Tax=Streptomyces sp. NPDC006482 TaxID=3154306 RepID=UPI0033BAF7D3
MVSAQHFHSGVLDGEFRAGRLGDGFAVAFLEGARVAGIGALTERYDIPVAWTPYFAVVDADVTAARIPEHGGTMAAGGLAFGTGRAGLAADPAGAVFGFWKGAVTPAVERHEHDTVALISGGALDEAPDPEVRPDWHVRTDGDR